MATATKDTTNFVTARGVLWYLVFCGFAINYMIRINLNIAIVSMIKARPQNSTALSSECLRVENEVLLTESNYIRTLNNNTTLTKIEIQFAPEENKPSTFHWNEKHQGQILGAYFWFHWLTQIPGGLLAQKYGTKLVFGLANFTGVLCCFLIPQAAYAGYQYLIAVRAIQGVLCGFAWPAMHNMTAKWIPPNERSKFVTAYLGSSVGAALTFPMCGYIIDMWGWEVVFYVSGVLGSLWYAAWFLLVFDSPAEHPRISQEERDYIHACLGESVTKEKKSIPWRSIVTSVPIWMNILAQWGGIWGLFTLMTHAPTYFKMIHGWNIKATGWLSGLPHLMRMAVAYVVSQIGDFLLRTNKLSRTNVRKLATFVCCIAQAMCMLGLAYSGCNKLTAIVFLTTATASHGAVSTGPLASFVDLSPNYASVTLGLCNTIIASIGFITPSVVGYLTYENQTVGQWQKVFWIACGMLMLSGVSYMIFGKSELQPWNVPEHPKGEAAEKEMEALHKERKASYVGEKDEKEALKAEV